MRYWIYRFAKQCAPEDSIMEMLDYWLRNSTEKPTWKDVAKAPKVIKLPQLAFDIESVYTTGKCDYDTLCLKCKNLIFGELTELYGVPNESQLAASPGSPIFFNACFSACNIENTGVAWGRG